MDEETRKQIYTTYQTGRNSIQDIARIFRVTVDEVLVIIGESHLGSVSLGGDLISPSEAGPGAQMNYGKEYKIPFTTD